MPKDSRGSFSYYEFDYVLTWTTLRGLPPKSPQKFTDRSIGGVRRRLPTESKSTISMKLCLTADASPSESVGIKPRAPQVSDIPRA